LHSLRKNQKRIFIAPAPASVRAGRARAALCEIRPYALALRKLHSLRKNQKRIFTAPAPASVRAGRARAALCEIRLT
ncbi:hypothetical protein PRIP_11499, partial [Listeria riparia FSL S10-1204]